jgi:alpha-tubulin suppressor-like RCC1 family protein
VEDEGVMIAYTSVYGNTKAAVELLAQKLEEKGCPKVVVNDLARCDMAEAVEDAFRYGKLVLATTTYNGDIFPYMKEFIHHLTERGFCKRTVGLMENGTCFAKGDNTYGQCDVYDWTDIVEISANANYTLGLRSDGTILAVGANTKGDWSTLWGGITSIAAGVYHAVGLRSDGSVVALGNNTNKQCEVSRWTRITSVAAGNFHTVGLRDDGTVVAAGHNSYGQCNVETWKDVIAIAAGRHHTVGLTKNGNILATGDNTYGQCIVADMSDIKTIGI